MTTVARSLLLSIIGDKGDQFNQGSWLNEMNPCHTLLDEFSSIEPSVTIILFGR